MPFLEKAQTGPLAGGLPTARNPQLRVTIATLQKAACGGTARDVRDADFGQVQGHMAEIPKGLATTLWQPIDGRTDRGADLTNLV